MISAKSFFSLPLEAITPEIEEEFFSSIMVRNGTYKTTRRDRFLGLNERLIDELQLSTQQDYKLLDVGISSGTSTLDLYNDLRVNGIDVEIVATDILIDAFLVEVFHKCFALVDDTGFPLRFDLFGLTMKPWVGRDDYRRGLFVIRKIINSVFTYRARRICRLKDSKRVSVSKLITRRLLENKNIDVRSEDISNYNDLYYNNFDIIRAANILNKSYFDDISLNDIVCNLSLYLKPCCGALFVVRTHDDHSHHGTLFGLDCNRRFRPLWRVGRGSEIEDIIQNHNSS